MSDDKLWDNAPDKVIYKNPKVIEAEKLLNAISDWACPPPIYELLKLLVEDLKERK
jgi:hypothetical protein